jgi:hypothetical protein
MAKLKGGTRIYGDVKIDGGIYDSFNRVGIAGSILASTGVGISWTTPTATSVVNTVAGTGSIELVRGNMADNDQFRILVGGTASNAGFVEIATADDGTEPIHVRQYTGVFTTLTRTATLLDGSGNTSFPGTLTAGSLVRSGGTSSQFLKADGTVDSNTYITSASVGNGTLTLNVSGTGLSGSQTFTANQSGNATFTVTSNATNANTVSTIVARDASGNFSAGTITASLTGSASNNVLKAGDTMTGQLISTLANNTADGGGQIFLNGTTGNRIDFAVAGVAAPATTTRSVGTKLVLYPGVTASNVDFALGIDSSTMWYSVNTTTSQFRWYGGTTIAATLTGAGNFSATGSITGNTIVRSGGTSSQFLKADGSVDSNSYITSASVGNGTLTLNVSGTGLSGSQTFTANQSGNATFTVTSNATSANTVSTIVARDASGNFSAGTITATLSGSASSVANSVTFNNGGTGAASGTTFNGSAAQTISHNTIGASPLAGSTSLTTTGTVTTGTWSASFGAVSGANLTSLTAGNLTGTIPSAVLGNSSLFVGTTSIALNRASASQSLTGVSIDGNSGTSTTLQTTRTIWGQNFNGSANVTGALSSVSTITFTAEASDAASIGPTISSNQTAFDFNLADDNNNDLWRWRFTPSGSTVYNAMTLTPTANGVSNLAVAGTVSGTQLISTVATGTAPLTVSSTTLVTNLNADLLDGLNSATTNTGSTIVARDASGNFSAGTITAALSGNSTTATTLQTTRTIWGQNFNGGANVTGALSGATTIDASSDISLGGELNFTTSGNKYIDFYTDNDAGALSSAFLRLVNNASTSFHIAIRMIRGADVELYHNNSLRLNTASDGVRILQSTGYWTGFAPQNNYVSASLEGGCYIDFRNESGVPKGSIHNIFFTGGGSELRFFTTAAGVARGTDTRTLGFTLQSDGITNFSQQINVPQNNNATGGGINFNSAGSAFIRGRNQDGASSTLSNLQLQSWFGIGFGPSISGQTVPQGENAFWINVRDGSWGSRGGGSINGNTVWHAGNDGSGSGLDADLFDGAESLTMTSSHRANRNISGGGTITVDASYNVRWTTRFIIISNGMGSNFSTNGYFDIDCPTTGTITGVGGAANQTATVAGIPLPAWHAIYYILPIGSANGSVAANFRVASYTSNLDIPHTWVLICVRNGDNGTVTFNNGITLLNGESMNSVMQDDANTVNTLVRRDASGNFSAGTITATLSGNATSATSATTATTASQLSFAASSSPSTRYLVFTDSLGGNSGANVNSAIQVLPSTGTITATAFSGSGASLTSLNASNLGSGTVPTARLASGTANSTTFLRGDQTWATISGGATLSNDTTTNATYFPTFSSATSGTYSTAFVSNTKCTFNPSTGTLSATVFTSLSDKSQKTNIRPIENALDITKQLDGVRFNWIDNNKPSIGVIAQEVETVLPELVEEINEHKTVNYNGLVGLLIEAIKEQQEQINTLRKEIRNLKK